MVATSDRFNENNPLVDSNMAIIVTSFDGHMMFLKNTLLGYKSSGKYVICSFDRHHSLIPEDVFRIPHSWTFKHKTHGAEKRNGWLWDIVYGAGVINLFDNFKYVFIMIIKFKLIIIYVYLVYPVNKMNHEGHKEPLKNSLFPIYT